MRNLPDACPLQTDFMHVLIFCFSRGCRLSAQYNTPLSSMIAVAIGNAGQFARLAPVERAIPSLPRNFPIRHRHSRGIALALCHENR